VARYRGCMAAKLGLIISSPDSLGVHPDDEVAEVVAALSEVAMPAEAVPWTANLDWSHFSALVLKSPWDYSMRPTEFSSWLSRVESDTVVLNHPALIRWNFDKRYLSVLGDAGVSVTSFVCAGSRDEASSRIASFGEDRVVIKPTVSAGSRNTGLFEARDPRALDLVTRILAVGKTPMILPALDAVERDGEHGLLYFGGRYSHCGRKAPILARGGDYLHGEYTETVTAEEPPPDEIELGESCLRVIADIAAGLGVPTKLTTPLYARIDIARDEKGHACVLEAELFEPSYFTHLDGGAADRFAAALWKYLD
jgi:hypothetical protein